MIQTAPKNWKPTIVLILMMLTDSPRFAKPIHRPTCPNIPIVAYLRLTRSMPGPSAALCSTHMINNLHGRLFAEPFGPNSSFQPTLDALYIFSCLSAFTTPDYSWTKPRNLNPPSILCHSQHAQRCFLSVSHCLHCLVIPGPLRTTSSVFHLLEKSPPFVFRGSLDSLYRGSWDGVPRHPSAVSFLYLFDNH